MKCNSHSTQSSEAVTLTATGKPNAGGSPAKGVRGKEAALLYVLQLPGGPAALSEQQVHAIAHVAAKVSEVGHPCVANTLHVEVLPPTHGMPGLLLHCVSAVM